MNIKSLTIVIACLIGCAPAPRAAAPKAPAAEPPPIAYVLPDAEYVIHIHSDALRSSGVRRALEATAARVAPDATKPFSQVANGCKLDWNSVEELVLSGRNDEHDRLGIAVTKNPGELVRCLATLEKGSKRATLWHLEGAELPHDGVAVARGDRVLVGSRRRVREALEHPPERAGAQDVLARLDGDDQSMCRIFAITKDSDTRAVALDLDADDAELNLTLSFDLPSTEEADGLANRLQGIIEGARGWARSAASDARMRRLLRNVAVSRRVGARVSVHFDAAGSAARQTDAFNGFVEMLGSATGIMRMQSSALAARANVMALAQRIAARADADRRGFFKVPTLLDAAPPTPANVPAGKKIAMRAGDWSHPTWRALQFALEGDIDHSYTIEVSRDRRVATVRATADLDGDGVTSLTELSVRITPQGKVIIDREFHLEHELD